MFRMIPWLAILVVFLNSTTAYAFKVDTHVWVGQQVINDLEDDGRLTFKLSNKNVQIAVNADVKNAILNNKNEYLIGNLGPDAIPDLLVGQTVNHPGIKDEQGNNIGWQTNDWLEYLLENISYSEQAKSFVFGYLSHAAADVFAHTYINQYAGDIFDLTDETLVEQRHYILETYMANHTPPLKNASGQAMGAPWQEIYLDDHYAEFVRDTLIYNDAVQSEYWKVPTAYHLAAFYEFRKAVDNLAEDGLWREIDVAIAQIFAAYYGVTLTSDQANNILDKANKIIDRLYAGSENVQEFSNNLYESASNFEKKVFTRLSSAVDRMQDSERRWLDKTQEWRRKLAELAVVPSCPKIPVHGVDCHWLKGCWPTVDWVDDPVCNADRNGIIAANNIILNAADRLEQEVLNYRDDLINNTREVHNEAQQVADSIHNVANAIIDLHQVIGADTSPIQAVLRGWRSDIDLAMTAYVKSTTQSMVNTMNPAASALEPIEYWFECYHLQMLGLPSPVANCEFRDSLAQIKESIENIILIIDEANSLGSLVGVPSTRELLDLRDRAIDEIVGKLKEKVSDKIVDILPPEIQELIVMLDEVVTDETLKAYFEKPETALNPKGLLMISDIADRVKAEMYLTGGKFNPDKYAAAHDAVVLAKMSLLNGVEFKQLAQAAGSVDYIQLVGNPGDPNYLKNPVASAFESIDGNHQWMMVPPPIPNTKDFYPPVTYTYASPMGFVPWQGDMRNKLFRKLFIGPLSPGIDAPWVTGMTRIVGSEYPYQVCAAYPFPSDIEDKTCTAITLIPVLSMMLN